MCQGVDRKMLKDHFRHIVLQFKAISTKYRNLIAHLRTHNMSSVSIEVGVPLKASLQHATGRCARVPPRLLAHTAGHSNRDAHSC